MKKIKVLSVLFSFMFLQFTTQALATATKESQAKAAGQGFAEAQMALDSLHQKGTSSASR